MRRRNGLENRNIRKLGWKKKKTTPFTLEFRKMKKEMTWHHQSVHPDVRKARFEKSEKREGTNLQPEILKDRVNTLGSSHNHTSRLAP